MQKLRKMKFQMNWCPNVFGELFRLSERFALRFSVFPLNNNCIHRARRVENFDLIVTEPNANFEPKIFIFTANFSFFPFPSRPHTDISIFRFKTKEPKIQFARQFFFLFFIKNRKRSTESDLLNYFKL